MTSPHPTPRIIDLREGRDDGIVREFYQDLYLPAFPVAEHREDLETWLGSLWAPADDAGWRRVLLIAGTELEDRARREIWGGHMLEFYPRSSCGLLAYLVVAPGRRRQGWARALVDRGMAALDAEARAGGGTVRAVFAECEDPRHKPPGEDAEAWERMGALTRLGARVIDVPYTAPALRRGGRRARDLLLLYFRRPERPETPPRPVILEFLREFYEALGVADPGADPDLRATEAALGTGPVQDVELRRETPSLRLAGVSVAFHFVRPPRSPHGELPHDETFHSFERDLVSYAYRDDPPFASEALRQPVAAEVAVPAEVDVRSEGRTIRTCCADPDRPGAGRRRTLDVRRSRTVFRDGIVVEHLVLTNLGRPDSALNEYDLVKLVKLHGGGDVSTVGARLTLAAGGRPLPFGEFLRDLPGFPGAPPLRREELRAATVLITSGDGEPWPPVYELVGRLHDEPREVIGRLRELLERCAPEAQALKAVEGIVCGLLNFGEIDHGELADALEPAIASSEYLLWLQKAALVCLTRFDRVTGVEACRRHIGTSPYLLAPHAVLLHNEEVLRDTAEALTLPDRAPRGMLERARDRVENNLKTHLLPNVFHYRTERAIVDAGTRNRGLDERAGEFARRL